MDDFRKHEVKQKIRKYKPILLGTGIFLIAGLAAFFIGFGLAYGWDYIPKMLTQPFAITVYIIIAIGLCVLAILYYVFWIRGKSK